MMQAIILPAIKESVILSDIEIPLVKEGEFLINLKAAALNHRDVFIQNGQYAGIKTPVILGSDGMGIVAGIGDGGDSSWLGKEVIINPGINWGNNESAQAKDYHILGTPTNGTFAQYITVNANSVHLKPAHLNAHQSAALPLAGLTAYRALMVQGLAKPDMKVLITGIGGGVAQLAMQFAIANKCKVYITSGKSSNIDEAIKMGAIGGINYHEDKWSKKLIELAGSEFDLIIDSACGDGFSSVIDCCKPGGKIVIFGGTSGPINNIIPAKIFWRQIAIIGSTMGSNQDFKDMIDFVNLHQITPNISKIFPLNQMQEALNFIQNGSQFGKVVIDIPN